MAKSPKTRTDFEVGQMVKWSSSGRGTTLEKSGVIVCVCDPDRASTVDMPREVRDAPRGRIMYGDPDRLNRVPESGIIVSVPTESGKLNRYYGPRAAGLHLVKAKRAK